MRRRAVPIPWAASTAATLTDAERKRLAATWMRRSEAEYLALALKGAKTGPRLAIRNWGGPSSAALTLTKLFTQWKRVYAGVASQNLGGDPPRMLVTGRLEGSIDYLIAFENRGDGYTLQLTVREGSYEKLRELTLASPYAQSLEALGLSPANGTAPTSPT